MCLDRGLKGLGVSMNQEFSVVKPELPEWEGRGTGGPCALCCEARGCLSTSLDAQSHLGPPIKVQVPGIRPRSTESYLQRALEFVSQSLSRYF